MNLDTYEREGRHAYAGMARTVAAIIEKIAEGSSDYRLQQVQHRAKGIESLRKKLADRDAAHSTNIESEIKDLAGVRVVLYTNSDVSRFISSGVISDNFEVDWDRTKFHYPMQEPTAEDGFISYNYVIRLNSERLALPEYALQADLSCEVQVQTTLEHAWSEMAHDTIYKPPPPGFGTRAMKSVADRMAAIMQKYLRPAGFEFQKVVADVRALELARATAEQDPLRQIADAADNNERHARIEAFHKTLGYYDDLPSRADEFRRAMVDAVKAARATPKTPRIVGEYSLDGISFERTVNEALDVIDWLRHLSTDAVDDTFAALAELYPDASDNERRRLKSSVEGLAKHKLHIWKAAGPIVEQRLVAAIAALDSKKRQMLADLVVETLRLVLHPELTGESSTFDTVTFHTGAVVASDVYLTARQDALSILECIILETDQLALKTQILQAFGAAGRLPYHGTLTAEMLGAVLSDSLRIVRFMTANAANIPYEIRQQYEHDLVWRYRHNRALPPGHREDPKLEAARLELQEAVLAYRDAMDDDKEFVIFNTLVGYKAVFPPDWEGDGLDIEGHTAFRTTAITGLVAKVNEDNFDRWLQIIGRCTRSEAISGGGCSGFRSFLHGLGRAKPELLERLFDQSDLGLDRYVATMLIGLEGTSSELAATTRIRGWIADAEHLGEIISYLESRQTFDPELLASAGHAATAAADESTVAEAMRASAKRYVEAPKAMMTVFLDGLAYFTDRSSGAWVKRFWFQSRRETFFVHLDARVRSLLLENLVHLPDIDFHAEDLLRDIARTSPADLLAFFHRRLARDRTASSERFDAIPFQFQEPLKETFAAIPGETVAAVRAWFDEDPETALFEYRGGAVIANAFPDLGAVVEPLQALIERAAERDLEFVLRVLTAYDGEPFILPLCRDIVARLPLESPLLRQADLALEQSGVVSGEFGFVEQYQERKAQIAPWLVDASPEVRAFAGRRSRGLDLQIAAENRRTRENLELRKRHYGEGAAE